MTTRSRGEALPPLSHAEAVRFAIASARIEGQPVSPDVRHALEQLTDERVMAVARGELTLPPARPAPDTAASPASPDDGPRYDATNVELLAGIEPKRKRPRGYLTDQEAAGLAALDRGEGIDFDQVMDEVEEIISQAEAEQTAGSRRR
jgi:hypothetical protein